MSRWISSRRAAGGMVAGLAVAMAAACSSPKATDPLGDLRNPRLSERQREKAVRDAWRQVEAGQVDRGVVRDELKTMAWAGGWPLGLRVAALDVLLSDPDPFSAQDNRQFVRLMLPREPAPQVVKILSETAVRNGWTDTTPALVRSLSRFRPGTDDSERPEYAAIEALNPGKSVDRVVYELFLNPPEDSPGYGLMPAERMRVDAWDLLARLDRDGESRAAMLLDEQAPVAGPVADMRASLIELRCLPVTGEELRWLVSMRDPRDPARRQWWVETASVVGGLGPDKGGKLQMRHLEAVRWASVHRSQWIGASREELLEELRSRLGARQVTRRRASTQERWQPAPEHLRNWESRLSWADLLVILSIDEALSDPAVVRALFGQIEMDRDDKTAEYGGLIRAAQKRSTPGTPPWSAVLYPPRPGNRRGDREFVASSDMIAQGDYAIAHYHFHAQKARNSEYAGPSAGDLAYAARMGRTCVVFTTLEVDAVNADLYQPDGVVLDLGVLRVPAEASAGR